MKKVLWATLLVASLVGAGAAIYHFYFPSDTVYFTRGKKDFDQKKFSEASIQFLNALDVNPGNRDARYYLALSFLNQNDGTRAVAQLKSLLEYFPDDVPGNLQLGDIYVVHGQSKPEILLEARRIAEKLLARDPKNVDALVLSGSASQGLQNYDAAALMFSRALSIAPSNVYALIKLGLTRMSEKRYAEAEENFLKAHELDSKNKAAVVALVNYYQLTGQTDKTENWVKEGLALDPADPGMQQLASGFYGGQGRFQGLVTVLKNAQEKLKDDPSPSLLLADLFVANDQPADVVSLLKEAKKTFPKNTDVAAKLAASLISAEPGQARTEIENILKADPQNPVGYLLLGELQFKTGQYDAAEKTLSSKQVVDSPYPGAHYLLGNLARRNGKPDEAIGHYQKAIAVNGSFLPARLALAQVFLDKGKPQDSRAEVDKMLKLAPGYASGRLFKAALDIIDGKFPEAEQTLTALLSEEPQNADIYRQMALLDSARGRTAEARKNLDRGLEIRPDSVEMLREVTALDIQDKQINRAVERIEAIPENKRQAFHYELLGSVYSRAGKPQAAEQAYQKALEKDPALTNAALLLSQEYERTGRSGEGLEVLDKLLQRNPTASDAYLVKGGIYRTQGNTEKARQSFSEALRLQPDSDAAANSLAYLLAEDGKDLQAALQYAQTARKKRPDIAAYADTLGWVYYKLADYPNAERQAGFAVSQQPDNGTYLYHLAKMYEARYKIDQALQTMQKAVNSKQDFKEKTLAQASLKELSR